VLRRQQEEVLRGWLNYLLDPAFSTTLGSSDTNARLRRARQVIAHLKSIDGGFVDEHGSFYTCKAVANLEEEEKHLLSERRNRTYGCRFFDRTAPKELGNVEAAERFGVSVLIVRNLTPTKNPYEVLQEDLATRGVFLSSKAVQMRVRRLERKVRAGQHMAWHQILQYQYRCYKYFLEMNLWLSRCKGLPPVGYLRKWLTLTVHEMKYVTKPCGRGGTDAGFGHYSLRPGAEERSTYLSLAAAGVPDTSLDSGAAIEASELIPHPAKQNVDRPSLKRSQARAVQHGFCTGAARGLHGRARFILSSEIVPSSDGEF